MKAKDGYAKASLIIIALLAIAVMAGCVTRAKFAPTKESGNNYTVEYSSEAAK